ncbi:MAG: hypothetical protein HC825_07810 [Oscillatoriales cyanobacterium RM1_1_9]|nr:hypothetical protein [Oscillatoriales cyanobacterium SM2_3_0]NJO44543.1 hypothetical protein [Oscillatoriales cyanobacterium RM2_1_1]NJO71611.1 hypothetical protein [Oscillatoriales cyanobacterium RM1_1_9]
MGLRSWWQNLVYLMRHYPPQFVEVVMLLLAIILLLFWSATGSWTFLVLCLSYAAGSSMAMLVREAMFPPPQFQATQAVAILLLLMSLCTLADLVFNQI